MKKAALFLVAALLVASPALAADKLKVVASTTYFADLVRQIGGERVDARAVAPPKFNVHFVQPRPSDVKNVRGADLYVHAGLDLEAWSDALLEAAGRPELFRGGGRNLDCSAGVPLLEVPEGPLSRAEGDVHVFGNPHYYMDPRNARTVAATIAAKLAELDPEGAASFEENRAAFEARLDAKLAEWKASCEGCAGREIVSYHKDIAYFADFLGLKAERFFEPKPGIPPSPKHLASLEAYMRQNAVRAIVMPVYYSRGGPDALAARTGARVAIVCQNPGEVPGTDDFFAFFDYNFRTIASVLGAGTEEWQ